MTAKLTFHPLGNADCTRIDMANGRKMLVDYADMRNPADMWDARINLPEVLKADLRAAKRDYYDVVCFTHLDDDHCCGSGDFFWLEHAAKYQGEGRIKIGRHLAEGTGKLAFQRLGVTDLPECDRAMGRLLQHQAGKGHRIQRRLGEIRVHVAA